MRRTMRLTERDFSRIVRRVITENDKGVKFLKSVDNDNDGDYNDYDGTNNAAMIKVIRSIKSKDEYDTINDYVVDETGKSIITWIRLECDEKIFRSEQTELFCHLVSLDVYVKGYDTTICQDKFYKNISCTDKMDMLSTDDMPSMRYGNIKYVNDEFHLYNGHQFFCKIK